MRDNVIDAATDQMKRLEETRNSYILLFSQFKIDELHSSLRENCKHFDGVLPVVQFSFLHWLTAKMVEEIN
ncbi:hypothetical protein T09_8908 [Trichinella sp. T9]|nr:hypothetical protein T09_8908 [Trichinella sp. T9]